MLWMMTPGSASSFTCVLMLIVRVPAALSASQLAANRDVKIGQALIALYLGRAGVASAYGAAGSLLVLLLWIYYSALILLFGAAFTRVYAERHGSRAGG